MNAAVQTIWAELFAATLVDAGVTLCVISPGSRSTPLVAALAHVATTRSTLRLVTIIDERAAAFFALGAARATGKPVALVCTSGTAGAHYLPAVIEASLAGVPLIVVTADRPPELQDCGASQTIDQVGLYGGFVRGAYDLGAPVAHTTALRAVHCKLVQAVTASLGPAPGPVHINVPLRKPLEPAQPSSDEERTLAMFASSLVSPRGITIVAPPRLAPDPLAISALAAAMANESRGVIVVGAMPVGFASAREAIFALAVRSGYPIVAEAGSQLRFGDRPDSVVFVDHLDLVPLDRLPAPALVLQLGAEPVAAGFPGWLARTTPSGHTPVRWMLAGASWRDPDSSARAVILGDIELAITMIAAALDTASGARSMLSDARTASPNTRDAHESWLDEWRAVEQRAEHALAYALRVHPGSEGAVIHEALSALPAGALLQIGNSLPIRVVDQVGQQAARCAVITQRGAAGIDGLIASAAGATVAGKPVLLVLGDVSFAHDLGGLLAARCATAPLAILVIDNGGGQIFAGLPVAKADLGAGFERHWLTAPDLDPVAVATALGAHGVRASTAPAAASAIAAALATPGITVIHAPVTASGARDLRSTAIKNHFALPAPAAHAAPALPEPALAKLGGDR